MTKDSPRRSQSISSVAGAARHSTFLFGAFIAISIVNYAFGVALSWFFTPAQFGVLGIAQSLLLLSALAVGSGFAWTTAHDLAASGTTVETRHRFRAAWLANVTLGLVLGAGLWAAYSLDWIPLGPAYRLVVPLVALTTVLLAARSVVNGAVRGLYRFGPLAVNQVGEVAIKAGAGLMLVVAGFGVAGVMAGFALGTATALAHSFWISRPARLWQARGWLDRRVLTTTMPLFMGMFGTALILNLDILGLKLLSPPSSSDELAGFYQAAVILARAPVFIAQSLSLVLFSYIAGASRLAQREGQGAAGHMEDAIRAWVRLLLPAGLALILAPQAALSLFFPARYHVAAPALQIAAWGGVLLALVTLLTVGLQAGGNRRRPALAAATATATQVAFLIWLVPRLGPLGAAWSLLAAGAVALIGLGPAFKAPLGRTLSEILNGGAPRLLRALLPLLALLIPLLVLPDGGREAALVKFGLAGFGYLVALIATHRWSLTSSRRPVVRLLDQFVHILIGG
jgi:O-antigen/teichoic acid export membrane protein